jgi:hypothetical protein
MAENTATQMTADDALRLVEAALGPIGSSVDDRDRRIYLAYLAAANVLDPLPSRSAEIAGLRERLGL